MRDGEFNRQDLVNTLWSFATLALADIPLFDAISAEAIPKDCQLTPQELANTLWALSTLQFEHGPLLTALSS
jgi:hypothetical protein